MFQKDGSFDFPHSKNTVGKFLEKMVLCFFALINLVILCLFLFTRLSGWETLGYISAAAYLVAVIFGCYIITRINIQPTYTLFAILCLSFVIRILYVLLIPTQPNSDFSLMYEAAQASAAGNFSWSHTSEGYFYNWAYQIPFVLYEAGLWKIFHSLLALKLLNVLFMVGINYLLYLIGQLYLPNTAAQCVAFLYAVFPGAVMYTSVLTNQHISLFFLLLGVLLLLRSKHGWELLLSGLCFAISDLMRPEVAVILVATLCCGVLRYIQCPNVAVCKRLILSLVLVFGCYVITKKLVELSLVLTGIAPNGIENHAPEWKFVLGLGNIEGYGSYSEEHIAILNIDDSTVKKELCAEIIRDLFRRSPKEILQFFMGKIYHFWTDPQDLEWSLWNLENSTPILPGLTVQGFRTYMQYFERGMLLLVYCLMLPAPMLLWKKKESGRAFFCVVVVCIIFCVYLLIEIQARYRYFAIPFCLLNAGITLECLTQLDTCH